MQIKSIVAGAAISLVIGVGSVSADERYLADTPVEQGSYFAVLNGIATEQMSVPAMADIRGAVTAFDLTKISISRVARTAPDTAARRSAFRSNRGRIGPVIDWFWIPKCTNCDLSSIGAMG